MLHILVVGVTMKLWYFNKNKMQQEFQADPTIPTLF